MSVNDNRFRPGERALTSGVYNVYHIAHAAMHRVIVLYGETFPRCLECGDSVTFELTHPALYVRAHPLFQSAK